MDQTINKYYYFRDDFEKVTQQFNPMDIGCLAEFNYSYIENILHEFESNNPNLGLEVYVTVWTVYGLPAYGENVIAFIMQDEWSREPRYREKVGAVFRACDLKPVLLYKLQYGSLLEKWANILGFLRDHLKDGLSGRCRSGFLKLIGQKLAPLYELPLGYSNNDPTDFISFEEREYIFSFSGSLQHRRVKGKIPSPKEIARNRMYEAIKELIASNPKLPINLEISACYRDSVQPGGSYVQDMMNSKFCLVPRGSTLDTCRYYEAIRFGCIPIMETVPDSPFYRNAPIIQLSKWSELEYCLLDLLKRPQELKRMHQDVIQWWSQVCSEKVVAKQLENHLAGKAVDYNSENHENLSITENNDSSISKKYTRNN
jgi:hypothetical protein